MAHLARTTPPEEASSALADFDNDVMRCLEESVGIELTPDARQQVQLPLRLWGIGLRPLGLHAPAAYISSFSAAQPPDIPYSAHPLMQDATARLNSIVPPEAAITVRDSLRPTIPKVALQPY